MYPLNWPGYLLLYNVVTLFALFFIRRQLQMTLMTTLIALVTLVSIGFIIPVSLEIIGLGWTISIMILFLLAFLSTFIFGRIKEDRELERQVEQVLKPHTPIFTPEADDCREDEDVGEIEADQLCLKEPPDGMECKLEIEPEIEPEIEQETEPEIEPETEPEIEPEIKPEIVTAAFKLEQIQKHYQSAVEAMERKKYSKAYAEINQALQLEPPWTARKMLTYQYVTILNQMGMYEHSIKQLRKLMDHLPIGKYESNFNVINQQITYLKALMRLLETEQKQNLSYTLIPESIRRQAKDDSLSTVVAECE